jgi:ATP synthase protein I
MTQAMTKGTSKGTTKATPRAVPEATPRAMSTTARAFDDETPDDDGLPAWKPLTREEARALMARSPRVSPWRVVVAQAVMGLASALVWGAIAWLRSRGDSVIAIEAAGSALWGAVAIALPAALMVRGMGRLPPSQPQAMVAGFLFWELVKIGLSVALLVGAAVMFRWLHWPALLVTLVICTKMNWLALLRHGPVKLAGPAHAGTEKNNGC